MERDKVMELFNGIMDRNFKVIGKKELKMDLVFGVHQKVIIMKVNGIIIVNMVKVYLNIEIVLIQVHLKVF
jgi:hypothetical protein